MNKIGFNVLAWSAEVSDKLLPIADRLKTIGYDGVECLVGSGSEVDYTRFGKHVLDLEMEATCVFVLGEKENPISADVMVRSKALDRIKWAIDRAHDLNSKILCGPFHSAHAVFSHQAPQDYEYSWSAELLHTAGDYALQANVTLALEALNRFECYLCNTMDQLTTLVNRAAHPNVKAMYDTHHANIEEKKNSEAIDKIAPLLHHVHISENDRGTPGDGHVQWDETFSALAKINYKGWLTVEAFSRSDPDFANSINVWRQYSEPWDMAEKGLAFIQRMCKMYRL